MNYANQVQYSTTNTFKQLCTQSAWNDTPVCRPVETAELAKSVVSNAKSVLYICAHTIYAWNKMSAVSPDHLINYCSHDSRRLTEKYVSEKSAATL